MLLGLDEEDVQSVPREDIPRAGTTECRGLSMDPRERCGRDGGERRRAIDVEAELPTAGPVLDPSPFPSRALQQTDKGEFGPRPLAIQEDRWLVRRPTTARPLNRAVGADLNS